MVRQHIVGRVSGYFQNVLNALHENKVKVKFLLKNKNMSPFAFRNT